MKSIRSIFKIGYGPSSSHTMGPAYAALQFSEAYPDADCIRVVLYGSLAKTGKGHSTDRAILESLAGVQTEIVWDTETETPYHPNTLDFIAFRAGKEIGREQFYSIGGGEIRSSDPVDTAADLYPEKSFGEIARICKERNIRLSDY
ncbi:MAG: serine dehydratase, partial [Clostridia bacterium]|nr:serine dehydratase [Clostridia bacterium]